MGKTLFKDFMGARGHWYEKYSWTTRRNLDLSTGRVSHSFIVIPDCPYPLLGRDLLTKTGAQIHFSPEGVNVMDPAGRPVQVLTMQLEDEYRLHQGSPEVAPETDMQQWLSEYPQAWAETGGPGLAKHQPPIYTELKPGAEAVKVKQYQMPQEAQRGIRPHIRRLLAQGILRPCQSNWNTPLLPVRKPGSNDYRPVQDLRQVKQRVMDIHPTVPNPSTLLSSLNLNHQWYMVLDLKDVFF